MSKTLKIILITAGGLVLAGGLVAGGFLLGSARGLFSFLADQRANVQVPFNERGGQGFPRQDNRPGRMLPHIKMHERLGPFQRIPGTGKCVAIDSLTEQTARAAVDAYLETLEVDGLEVGSVILFDNHAYASVLETDSGAAAFEVRVMTGGEHVFAEPNPWNLKYSGDAVGRRGLRGTVLLNPEEVPEMTVTAEQAGEFAQAYLESYLPDAVLSGDAVAFPGYFTLLAETGGEISAILHVNGYTGQTYADRFNCAPVETDA